MSEAPSCTWPQDALASLAVVVAALFAGTAAADTLIRQWRF